MAKRTKVPRASIACTILDDPDYMGLVQTSAGRNAFALFCALLAAAKAQDNKGSFKHPTAVVAAMVRWPIDDYAAGVATLCAETNWLTCDAQVLIIRSFKKWNSWGGKREQDCSKIAPKTGARLQQDGSKSGAKPATPVSVSVTDELPTTLPPRQARRSWAGDWESSLAKLLTDAGTAADRCKCLNSLKAVAGAAPLEQALRDLEQRGWLGKDISAAYAYIRSILQAKAKPEAQPKVSAQHQRGLDAYDD